MVQLLYKYLIIHNKVCLPGVGIFYIERKPAKHDYANSVFRYPALDIHFKPEPALAAKDFFEFVSKEKGIDEAVAVKHLHDFASQIKNDVKANRAVELPGIGILKTDAVGQVNFQATSVLDNYFAPIPAETIKPNVEAGANNFNTIPQLVDSSTEEVLQTEPRQRSYWWIYALLLALLGFAAIAYYYYQYGSLR